MKFIKLLFMVVSIITMTTCCSSELNNGSLNCKYSEANNESTKVNSEQVVMRNHIGSTLVAIDYSGDESANLIFEYWLEGKFESELLVGRDIKLSEVNYFILGINPLNNGSSEIIGQVLTDYESTIYSFERDLNTNNYSVSYESTNSEMNDSDVSQEDEIYLWAINKGNKREFQIGDSLIEDVEMSEWSVVAKLEIID